MHYVGLDVHTKRSSLCVLDGNGQRITRKEVVGGWSKLGRAVEALPRPFSICFEASCGYGTLHERLSAVAERVVVAHPGQLGLIFRAKRKNDRVDAEKLAKLLFLDQVPQVHVPGVDVRQWRSLIEFRGRWIDRRTAVKNQIRAVLRGAGVTPVKGLWRRAGQAWLREVQLPWAEGLRVEMLADELDQLNARVRRVERELRRYADRHPAVALLRTIPGVGLLTSSAFVAYVDDIHRFGRVDQVAAYFGLVPCQDASAGVNRLGHITKDGPATARKLLCEAAWQATMRNPEAKMMFQRVMRGDPTRRKIAIIATPRPTGCVDAWRRCCAAGRCTGRRHDPRASASDRQNGMDGRTPPAA